jgi:hypothetical protein
LVAEFGICCPAPPARSFAEQQRSAQDSLPSRRLAKNVWLSLSLSGLKALGAGMKWH